MAPEPRSQVTTKGGDGGETSALSGDRFPKSHPIMECVGTVDELRAHTALARQIVLERHPQRPEPVADFLLWLLHTYFLIGSSCSDPLNKHPEYRRMDLSAAHLDQLERFQMSIEERVRLPHAFIVSAANPVAAQIDVTTTVARRLERAVVRLKEAEPEWQAAVILQFLNRLSDCLYMVARYLEQGHHQAVDYKVLDRGPGTLE